MFRSPPSKCLCFERLESRQLLAGDWHNANLRCDVDDSGLVTPLDVLLVINFINNAGVRTLVPNTRGDSEFFVDVSNDGLLSAVDVLQVINTLNESRLPMNLTVNVSPEHDPNGNRIVHNQSVTLQGTSVPNAKVQLFVSDSLVSTVLSDGLGKFVLPVSLAIGSNEFSLIATDDLGRRSSTSLEFRLADVVADWNATALNVVREWSGVSDDPYEGRIVPSEPPRVARNLAMIHLAMFEAANAVDGQFESYLGLPMQNGQISKAAAAAQAAFAVASALYPDSDSMNYWSSTLAESLATVPDGLEKSNGVAWCRRGRASAPTPGE
ncbi:MAG: dockerin type I domain-containing protein [Pirellulaceae bacterium]